MTIVPHQNGMLQIVNGLLDDDNIKKLAFDKLTGYEAFKEEQVVEALPTENLYVGREIFFKVTTGIYWHLIYTEEATYPWAKIGGPPMVDIEKAEVTSETETLAVGTELTIPLAGEYRLRFGAGEVGMNGTQYFTYINLYEGSELKYETLSGVEPLDRQPMNVLTTLTLAAAKVMTTKYKVQAPGGHKSGFKNLFLEIDPIRVG